MVFREPQASAVARGVETADRCIPSGGRQKLFDK